MRTLFFDTTGPLVKYGDGMLHVADLNPEIATRWRMSRWQIAAFGIKALLAALLSGCAGMSMKDTASHERITTKATSVPGQPGDPFVGVPGVRGAI